MNAWTRGGVSLIKLPELARAAELSGERVERCAYVLRVLLDSTRRRGIDDGIGEVDAHDVAFTLDCAPAAIDAIVAAFLSPGVGFITWRTKWLTSDDPVTHCGIARWRDWAVEREFLANFD